MGSLAWTSSLPDAGVKTDLLNDGSDGTLSYAGAVQILTDVASRGAVTAAELSSLQTVAAHLNNGLSASAYVAVAFAQIVDGSPANATWTGGSTTPVALGNLQVGSTSAQLSELIGKWLLGTDLPDSTLPPGSAFPQPAYSMVVGPIYGSTGAASVADICQGADGDCELLAGLIEVVENHPQQLASMFVDNGNGTYGVRFYVGGNEIWETVNDQLPTADGTLQYAHNTNGLNTALWAPLLEKAYAQLSATGLLSHPAVNSYGNINADPATDVLRNLVDCTDVAYHFSSDVNWTGDKPIFLNALANGDDVVLETSASSSYTYDGSGNIELVPDHAFAVVGYDSATGDFIVRNSWGNSYPTQNWDPQFEVSLDDIAADDGDIVVDNSGTHGSTIVVRAVSQQLLSSGSPVTGLFRVTNSSGRPITQYMLQAIGPLSISLNGAANLATGAETTQGQVVISVSDLSKVTLSGSATSETSDLFVSASDGSSWSAATDIPLTVSAGVALTQPLDLAVAPGATVTLSSLFNVSGPLGVSATVEVNLPSGNGALNLNGATNFSSDPGIFYFWATQLSQVTYSAPTSGGTPQLQFIVNNGATWSPWLTENLTLSGVNTAAVAIQDYENGQFAGVAHVVDSAANIFANLDTFQDALAAGALRTIAVSDSAPQVETMGQSEYSRDRGVLSILTGKFSVNVAPPAVGDAAILWQNADGRVAIWEMSGTNLTGSAVVADPSPSWHAIGTGHLGGGSSDLLLQNTDGRVAVWDMNGTNLTSSAVVANPGPSWGAVGIGDFNGDAHSDILLQNVNGSVAIWEMTGTSVTGSAVVANPGPNWKVVGTGDFDDDGHSDILLQNTNGSVAFWEMNGTSLKRSAVVADPGPTWKAIGTGDFNGDSHSDILLQNADRRLAIWEMNGTSMSASSGILSADPGPGWHAIGTNHGGADILLQNASGQTAIWGMSGTNVTGSGVVSVNPGMSWRAMALT